MTDTNQDTLAKVEQLEQRVVELETKLAFMDETVNEQTGEIQRLLEQQARTAVQINYLAGKLKAIEPSNVADQSEETPPPHY